MTQDADTISELFARDPLEWDEAMMERMVVHLRQLRKNLDAEPEKKTKEKVPKEDLSALDAASLLGKLGL